MTAADGEAHGEKCRLQHMTDTAWSSNLGLERSRLGVMAPPDPRDSGHGTQTVWGRRAREAATPTSRVRALVIRRRSLRTPNAPEADGLRNRRDAAGEPTIEQGPTRDRAGIEQRTASRVGGRSPIPDSRRVG
jgi:hypothetical protein